MDLVEELRDHHLMNRPIVRAKKEGLAQTTGQFRCIMAKRLCKMRPNSWRVDNYNAITECWRYKPPRLQQIEGNC